jgi:hypothetical protein
VLACYAPNRAPSVRGVAPQAFWGADAIADSIHSHNSSVRLQPSTADAGTTVVMAPGWLVSTAATAASVTKFYSRGAVAPAIHCRFPRVQCRFAHFWASSTPTPRPPPLAGGLAAGTRAKAVGTSGSGRYSAMATINSALWRL